MAKHIKKFVFGLVIFASTSSISAIAGTTYSISGTQFLGTYGATHVITGNDFDTYTFNILGPSVLDTSLKNVTKLPGYNFSTLTFSIFDAGSSLIDTFQGDGASHSTLLNLSGDYKIIVSGDATSSSKGKGIYSLGISANAAAVPEPELYALMLAGLGLVGFAARRKNNAV